MGPAFDKKYVSKSPVDKLDEDTKELDKSHTWTRGGNVLLVDALGAQAADLESLPNKTPKPHCCIRSRRQLMLGPHLLGGL